MPEPPAVPPPAPSPPTLPQSPLSFVFQAVPAGTSRAVTTITVTFNRPVTGVTVDDFVLRRAGGIVSLAAARITTTDRTTYTISGIRGTNLAAPYTLRLKATGTGIAADSGTPLAVTKFVAWRMLRTVAARPATATALAGGPRITPG
jgi:hypothetical protein